MSLARLTKTESPEERLVGDEHRVGTGVLKGEEQDVFLVEGKETSFVPKKITEESIALAQMADDKHDDDEDSVREYEVKKNADGETIRVLISRKAEASTLLLSDEPSELRQRKKIDPDAAPSSLRANSSFKPAQASAVAAKNPNESCWKKIGCTLL